MPYYGAATPHRPAGPPRPGNPRLPARAPRPSSQTYSFAQSAKSLTSDIAALGSIGNNTIIHRPHVHVHGRHPPSPVPTFAAVLMWRLLVPTPPALTPGAALCGRAAGGRCEPMPRPPHRTRQSRCGVVAPTPPALTPGAALCGRAGGPLLTHPPVRSVTAPSVCSRREKGRAGTLSV